LFRRLTCNNEEEGNKIVYFNETVELLTPTVLARRQRAWSCCRVGAKSEVLKQLVLHACGKMPGRSCFLLHGSKTVISR
jgi:hypothetical protein